MMQRRVRNALFAGCGAVVLAAIGSPPTASAQTTAPELQAILEGRAPDEVVAVIVEFTDKVDLAPFRGRGRGQGPARAQMIRALKEKAEANQGRLRGFLMSQGTDRIVSLWAIHAVAVSVPAAVIPELAAQPGVARVRPDAKIPAPQPAAGSASVPEWNLDAIRAPDYWSLGHSGAGVVVATLDTGVDVNHPDLASRWRGGGNGWFDPNGEHPTPYDRTGHGTQVMGLLVGGDAGGSAIGVAPDAQWIAVKIFDDAGNAATSAIHEGFQWVLDPDGNPATDDAADVANNSWGYPQLVGQCYQEFEPDIEVLKAAGIAVVFSGGNRGPYPSTSESPANNPEGFGVGAIDDFNTIATFSGRGPSACDGTIYPEVVAPGVNVRTTDLTLGGTVPDAYVSVTGTSAAAPHVSGAMALLMSAHPNASVEELEQALESSALDLGAIDGDDDYGYGLIDVVAAGDFLANPPPPACTDGDGDGFFVELGCGTSLDCDDSSASINPAACDIKWDGIDQDCDGQDRTKGKSCPSSGGGGDPTTGSEGKGNSCSDGADNDGDGLVDCADPDCSRNKSCR